MLMKISKVICVDRTAFYLDCVQSCDINNKFTNKKSSIKQENYWKRMGTILWWGRFFEFLLKTIIASSKGTQFFPKTGSDFFINKVITIAIGIFLRGSYLEFQQKWIKSDRDIKEMNLWFYYVYWFWESETSALVDWK